MSKTNLLKLFLQEAETHTEALSQGLLEWESDTSNLSKVEPLMRAAHSLKGAARIVGLDQFSHLAHALEDCFVAAQEGKITLNASHYDILLKAVDFMSEITGIPEDELSTWPGSQLNELKALKNEIDSIQSGKPTVKTPEPKTPQPSIVEAKKEEPSENAFHDVFKNQVIAQLEVLQGYIDKILKDSQSLKDPTPLIIPCEAIYGTSVVANEKEAEVIAQELIDGFLKAKESGTSINAAYIESIIQKLNRIKEIALGTKVEASADNKDVEDHGINLIFKQQLALHAEILKTALTQLKEKPNVKIDADPLIDAIASIKGVSTVSGNERALAISEELDAKFQKYKGHQFSLEGKVIDELLVKIKELSDLASEQKLKVERTPTPKAPTPPPEARIAEPEAPTPPPEASNPEEDVEEQAETEPTPQKAKQVQETTQKTAADNIIRVSASNLNRLMGLAAESLIETRRLQPMRQGFLQLKNLHSQLKRIFDSAHSQLSKTVGETLLDELSVLATDNSNAYRKVMQNQIDLYDDFSRNNSLLSSRLYGEVLASRMRPFAEGIQGFPRLVRNLSRSLNKPIQLEISGKETPVDRDILEKLEAPINHLIRNSCDHGIESLEERKVLEKPEKGTIKLQARHSGGMLLVTINDDGAGIDREKLRKKILDQKLLTKEMASTLSDEEILNFLFLPGFSTAKEVTEISGRGVGLDVVQNLMQEVGGSIRVETEIHKGTTFHLKLPITRSVIRALMVKIDGELYAFPLSQINRTLRIFESDIQRLEGQKYFHIEEKNIAILSASQALALSEKEFGEGEIPVIVLGENKNLYSLTVDSILGETELVARPLDPRLGKVPCVSAASITDDGTPILILDIDDLLSTVERILSGTNPNETFSKKKIPEVRSKTILVVDDSATVRETQRQLLEAAGYTVEVATDGVDGWNTLRAGKFDLVVSDVDMPRMNGFEFVALIRKDPNYKDLPVIIVSYKDKEEHKKKGLEIGANFYLTKSSFRDNTFMDAVQNLIGGTNK